jgi:hypothetical protein
LVLITVNGRNFGFLNCKGWDFLQEKTRSQLRKPYLRTLIIAEARTKSIDGNRHLRGIGGGRINTRLMV